jgi:hypothetical protein
METQAKSVIRHQENGEIHEQLVRLPSCIASAI